MLQWMGGSRRKLRATAKSLKARQHQFFEQRRQERKEQTIASGQELGINVAEQEKRSLDVLGLENLCSAPPCVHVSQTIPGADQADEGRQSGTNLTKNEKKHLPRPAGFTVDESDHIQLDNPSPGREESAPVANKSKTDKTDAGCSHHLDSGTQTNPEKSVKTAAQGLRYQPDFKILDIIEESKGEVSTQKPSSESYATFTFKDIDRDDQHTPETVTNTKRPLPGRSAKSADEQFRRKYPAVRSSTSTSMDDQLFSHADAGEINGCCMYGSMQRPTRLEIQQISELNSWIPSSTTLGPMDDDVSSGPLDSTDVEENAILPWNPVLCADSDLWNYSEFKALTGPSFLETNETHSPILRNSLPEPMLLTVEPWTEDCWSSPELRPRGCKPVQRDFVFPPFQDGETQSNSVVTNYRTFPERTPRNICIRQVECQKCATYISSPGLVEVLDLGESKLPSPSVRTDCDKGIVDNEDFSGGSEITQGVDSSCEWSSLQWLSVDDTPYLDDWIQKTPATSSPSASHPVFSSQLGDFEAELVRCSSDILSNIETEGTEAFSEQNLELQSIWEESSDQNVDSRTDTFVGVDGDVVTGSSHERTHTVETARGSSWHSFSGDGSTPTPYPAHIPESSFNMFDFGQGDHTETTAFERAGTTDSGSSKSGIDFGFSMFIRDLETESNLQNAETLIVYFPTTNKERETTPHSSVSRSMNEESNGTDFTRQSADEKSHHSLSSLHARDFHPVFTVNGQDASSLRGEYVRYEDGIENLSGERWNETDHLLDRFSTDTTEHDGNVEGDDQMDIHSLSQKLQQFEFELLKATSATLETAYVLNNHGHLPPNRVEEPETAFGETAQNSLPTSQNAYSDQRIRKEIQQILSKTSDRPKSSTPVCNFLCPDKNLYQKLEGHVQSRENWSDRQTDKGTTKSSQETLYGNKERERANDRDTQSISHTSDQECSSQLRRQKESLHLNTEEGREKKRSRCDHDREETQKQDSFFCDNQPQKHHNISRTQQSSLGDSRYRKSQKPTCFSLQQRSQTSDIKHRVEENEASYRGRESGCTRRSEPDNRKPFNTCSDFKSENSAVLFSQQQASHTYDKDGRSVVGRDISDHNHPETNRNSSCFNTQEEHHQTFTWSQDKLHDQATSLRSSCSIIGNRTASLGQRQVSCRSIAGENCEGLSERPLNLRRSEDPADHLSRFLESECSNKDEAYEKTRCIADRRLSQKSSSYDKIGEEYETLVSRKGLPRSQATSVTSSSKDCGGKIPCQRQQGSHRSNCRETAANNSHQQPSSDPSTRELCDCNTRQHQESSAIDRPTKDHQVLSQQSQKGPTMSLPDGHTGNETGYNRQQQEKQGLNSGEQSKNCNAGMNPCDHTTPQQTLIKDTNDGDNQGGPTYQEKGHEGDPHQKHKDEQSAACSCHMPKKPSSNKGATNDGTFADFDTQHEVTPFRTSLKIRQVQSNPCPEDTVNGNSNHNIHREQSRSCSLQRKRTELLTCQSAKRDGPYHPEDQLAMSEKSRIPSASTRLNTDTRCVEEEEEKNIAGVIKNLCRSSQTSKLETQNDTTGFILQLSSTQPVPLTKSTLGGRSSEEVNNSEAGERKSQAENAETPGVRHTEGKIRETPKTNPIELPVDCNTTMDTAQSTPPRKVADNRRNAPLPTDGPLHNHHKALATSASPSAENLAVLLNRSDPGGKCGNEDSKLSESQQKEGRDRERRTARNGGQSVQEAGTQYVTMLESFVMQLKFENRILQETLAEQQTLRSRSNQKES